MLLIVALALTSGCDALGITSFFAGPLVPAGFGRYAPPELIETTEQRRHDFPVPHSRRLKSGTGFFVSEDGLLATSAHVISDCRQILIWPRNGGPLKGHVIGLQPEADIAVLSTEHRVTHYAAPTQTPALRIGTRTLTIGYGVIASEPQKPIVYDGVLLGTAATEKGKPLLVIRSNLHAGNSGGPVIDASEKLLGIVIGRSTDRPDHGLAIPSSGIADLLRNSNIPPVREPGTHRHGKISQPTEFLIAISALVQCLPNAHVDYIPKRE